MRCNSLDQEPKPVSGTNIIGSMLSLLVILSAVHFGCEKYVKDESSPAGTKKGDTASRAHRLVVPESDKPIENSADGETNDNAHEDIVKDLLNIKNATTDTQALIESLKDEDWRERYVASRALGWLRWKAERVSPPLAEDTEVIEALIEALKDKDHRVRRNICWAFAKIKDERATEPLVQVLKNDKEPDVRSEAAWALG